MKRGALALAMLAAVALPAHAAQVLALSAEQRLQRAEDELAIRRLLVDYAWTQDARDFPAYTALFARNGEWVNGATVHKGPDDILKMLVGIYGQPQPGFVNRDSFHLTTNIQIDIDGDRATAHSRHLLFTRGADGRPRATLAGRYEDQLIREDGKWKILRRVDTPVMPTAEEWGKMMRARAPAKMTRLGWLVAMALLASSPAAAQRNETADRAAIHALLVAYGATLDARDFDGFAKLFGSDGVYVRRRRQGSERPGRRGDDAQGLRGQFARLSRAQLSSCLQ